MRTFAGPFLPPAELNEAAFVRVVIRVAGKWSLLHSFLSLQSSMHRRFYDYFYYY